MLYYSLIFTVLFFIHGCSSHTQNKIELRNVNIKKNSEIRYEPKVSNPFVTKSGSKYYYGLIYMDHNNFLPYGSINFITDLNNSNFVNKSIKLCSEEDIKGEDQGDVFHLSHGVFCYE